VAACAAGVFFLRGGQQTPVRSYGLVNPRFDRLIATVNATGQIAPVQTVNLSFAVTGRVAEVLARPGDTVEKGQPLARLDTRELELRLAQAEAQLAQAQANLDRLLAGPSPAEIAAAEAQLAQAAGQLRQVEGSVTVADMRAAEEQLRQAEARLNQLLAGPRESDVQTAEARIREAAALDGVSIFVAACPKDITMFRDAVKTTGSEARLVVKDLIELVSEAL